jgi:hypothetical protein
LFLQRGAANEESQMLNVASEKLTEREREYLKHFRESQAREVSFAAYCRSVGLKANQWHTVRHGMVRKGLLPAGGRRSARKKLSRQKRSKFIPVRVQARGSEEISGTACRLRHASGWVIECAGLPELQWLKGLIGGAQP